MQTNEFILSVLNALPEHRVEGKKRLQKLCYFLKRSGSEFEANFALKNFGPYSSEVDNATALLAMFGGLEETSRTVGSSAYLTTVFSLPQAELDNSPYLDDRFRERLMKFDQFSTLELEIASTVDFFMQQQNSFDVAVGLTREMKPTKTTDYVLSKVPQVLDII